MTLYKLSTMSPSRRIQLDHQRWVSGLKGLRDLPELKGPPPAVSHIITTEQNIANVTSLLVGLVNAYGGDMAPKLVAAISVWSEYVLNVSTADPVKTIKEMKLVQQYYLGLLRGSPIPLDGDTTFKYLSRSKYTQTHDTASVFFSLQYDLFKTMTMVEDAVFYSRVVYACLSMHRVISVQVPGNYTTITDPPTYSDTELKKLVGEIPAALSDMGISAPQFKEALSARVKSWRYKVSEKGGPNGRATQASPADAKAMFNYGGPADWFTIFASAIGMTQVLGTAQVMANIDTTLGAMRNADPKTGRIHEINELGGKTRLVAIVDYWTQTILAPVHYAINDILKTIPADGTFDQDSVASIVKSATASSEATVYSFDLSAATDRVPLALQTEVMSVLLNDSAHGEAWGKLLVDRDYEAPDGTDVRYATGQPMGALSSFAMFALTHHIIIRIAARRANIIGFDSYVIIGDDVAIFNTQVANKYIEIMDSLGVPINMSKSVLHSEGLMPAGEIAKRTYVHGVEVSGIPVKLLAKLAKFGRLAPVVQNHLMSRDIVQPSKTFINWIAGSIDTESLETLLKINAAPSDVVGLSKSVGPYVTSLAVEHWSPDVRVTDSDVLDAYTFTLISEQLKRLDALLRQTDLVQQLIIKSTKTDEELARMSSEGNEAMFTLLNFLRGTGTLDRRHPLQVAAFQEAKRVGAVLAGLRAGTVSLERCVRLGLLDSLRNSVWDSSSQTDEDRAQVMYNVFLSSLNSLSRITKMPGSTDKKVAIPRVLEFTIPILALSRSYTVYWRLGSGVYVNMIKTRISSDIKDNENKVTRVLSNMTMLRPRAR